jgi:hypothetical protein
MKLSNAVILSWNILFQAFIINIFQVHAAIQFGPKHADTYAGGITYDPSSNKLYVTGTTYEPSGASQPNSETSCFLGTLSLPDLEWVDQSSFGSPDIPEACTAVAIGSSSAVVIGSTQKGGLYTDQGTNTAQQYGFIMNVGLNGNGIGSPLSGVSLQNSKIQSPVSVTTHGSQVFVSSISSNDSSLSSDDPNMTSGQHYISPTYGTLIHKFTLDGPSLNHDWMQQVSDSSASNVYVGGLLVKENILLVVGSTTGEKSWEDGYITKHDLDTGNLAGSQGHTYMWGEMLTGICDDPNDPDSFYVVGTTRTDGDLIPILTKMRLDTLSAVWTKSLRPISPDEGVSAKAHGLACQVSGDAVYVAGTVEGGAHLENVQSSGSDDIFVAQLQGASGSLNWIRQVGSSEKDTLAHGGGLAVDAMGNAVLYGSTNGSFFREKEGESFTDIFVVAFQKSDGSYVSSRSGSSIDEELSSDREDLPPPAKAPGDLEDSLETLTESFPGPSDIEEHTTSSMDSSTGRGDDSEGTTGTTGAIAEDDDPSLKDFWASLYVPAILVLLAGCCICFHDEQRRSAGANDHRTMMSIFKFVHAFDTDDVDIKRSPTGGYHAIYLNDLANGKNTYVPGSQDEEDSEMASMRPNDTPSSIEVPSRQASADESDDARNPLSTIV